jgi:protein-tyrosine-phosphatase
VTSEPIRVLFVSTSNASRSILAEAILRRVGGDRFAAASAGVEPTDVQPLTRRVLEAAGFDHDWARSTSVFDLVGEPFDYVITLCDDARLACPVFPGADQSLHWGYKDPAGTAGDDDAKLAAYDRVFRDLSERVRQFVLLAGRTSIAGVA